VSLFKGTKEYSFHLSVGAILVNSKGEVCCHHYPEGLPYESGSEGELYLLMRETPHDGESIEGAVHRGIKEEFGAEGEIGHYIGAIESWFPGVKTGVTISKTTIYFLVRLIDLDLGSRDNGDIEQASTVTWIEPEKLKKIFVEQGKRFKRTDLDESKIIQNFINLRI
jgi:ADP-ribose pyrophosphatase YjhB (NUDIX family)